MPPQKPTPEVTSPAATCKGCGARIMWSVTSEGKRIPLDERAPVYLLSGERKDGLLLVNRTPRSYVSHFATCPKASEYSKKNQPEKEGSRATPHPEHD